MLLKTFCFALLLVGISARNSQKNKSVFPDKQDSRCDSDVGCSTSSKTRNPFVVKRGEESCYKIGIIYEGVCSYVIIDDTLPRRIDYFNAKTLCNNADSSLGDIYSQTHYDRIVSDVSSRGVDAYMTFVNFWTGLERDTQTGKVYLSDGTPAPYTGQVRNSREWSTTDASRQFVYVSVWTDGESHDSNPGGFGNVWPSQMWNGVLCQFPIWKDEDKN